MGPHRTYMDPDFVRHPQRSSTASRSRKQNTQSHLHQLLMFLPIRNNIVQVEYIHVCMYMHTHRREYTDMCTHCIHNHVRAHIYKQIEYKFQHNTHAHIHGRAHVQTFLIKHSDNQCHLVCGSSVRTHTYTYAHTHTRMHTYTPCTWVCIRTCTNLSDTQV